METSTTTPVSKLLQPATALPQKDRQYCDAVLSTYLQYITHINKLIQYLQTQNEVLAKEMGENELATFCRLSYLEKPVEQLEDLIKSTRDSFLHSIESYFSKEYSLQFTSLEKTNKHYLPASFDSYRPILQNIMIQVGDDFTKVGAAQIKERFQSCFHANRVPTLKGAKISLPNFAVFDNHYGDRISLDREYCKSVTYLLDAIALTFFHSTQRPKEFEALLSFLKNEIDFSKPYELCPAVCLHFFKNKRIDLVFLNEVSAQKFWNFYQLQRVSALSLNQ